MTNLVRSLIWGVKGDRSPPSKCIKQSTPPIDRTKFITLHLDSYSTVLYCILIFYCSSFTIISSIRRLKNIGSDDYIVNVVSEGIPKFCNELHLRHDSFRTHGGQAYLQHLSHVLRLIDKPSLNFQLLPQQYNLLGNLRRLLNERNLQKQAQRFSERKSGSK